MTYADTVVIHRKNLNPSAVSLRWTTNMEIGVRMKW